MAKAMITRERIEELLRFLPALGNPGPDAEPTWRGLDQNPSGDAFIMPYPTYPPVVEEFFTPAAQEWWCDYGYDPEAAGAWSGRIVSGRSSAGSSSSGTRSGSRRTKKWGPCILFELPTHERYHGM
jgi:hypothetical protein